MDGLLTQGEANYLRYLEMRQSSLETLFKQDEAKWAQNLMVARREADEMQGKIEDFIPNQQMNAKL